jgi:broad specificity phosphatase PhoE
MSVSDIADFPRAQPELRRCPNALKPTVYGTIARKVAVSRCSQDSPKSDSLVQTTRLTLICHARTVAQKLARFPTNEPVEDSAPASDAFGTRFGSETRVLCGPELRTRQTAAWFSTNAQVDEALRDCDWGLWHGKSIKELQREEGEALQAWLGDSRVAPPDGESVEQLCARVGAWLQALQAMPGDVVAVTHPFVIRAALMHVVQGAAFNAIDVEPLSTVELRFNGVWRLRLPGLGLEGAV